jgi:hypothetical protein
MLTREQQGLLVVVCLNMLLHPQDKCEEVGGGA